MAFKPAKFKIPKINRTPAFKPIQEGAAEAQYLKDQSQAIESARAQIKGIYVEMRRGGEALKLVPVYRRTGRFCCHEAKDESEPECYMPLRLCGAVFKNCGVCADSIERYKKARPGDAIYKGLTDYTKI